MKNIADVSAKTTFHLNFEECYDLKIRAATGKIRIFVPLEKVREMDKKEQKRYELMTVAQIESNFTLNKDCKIPSIYSFESFYLPFDNFEPFLDTQSGALFLDVTKLDPSKRYVGTFLLKARNFGDS